MIPGIGGRLVSHAYLEQQLLPELRGHETLSTVGEFERRMALWWRRVARSLGPAASARQVFDVATSPLLEALGYAAPSMRSHGDLLAGVGKVNLICANLPYIPTAELETLPVAKHEPTLALDGGPDGLRVIERLLATAGDPLLPGGALLAEIGATQGQVAMALARKYFPSAHAEVYQDLAGLDSLLEITL